MSTTRFCPTCGALLPADAPEGLCPQCLLRHELPTATSNPEVGAHDKQSAPEGPAAALQPSDLAGRFPELEILELLGQGGMGAVYKARQRELDRIVALKILPPETSPDPGFAERFLREARTLAKLNHPNIVVIHEFGHKDDLYYLIMEYVDGVNLRHLLRAGKLQPQEALKIVPQICEALQSAHDEAVVHRDIKPENILLDKKGRVKIADFGIAKMLGRKAAGYTLTGPWQVVGTLHYMAPEQMEKPLEVDHRADIYSLGVVFYEMLTGELPLGRFVPPSQKVQVDIRLDEVVLHALEREPERRYQHASDVKTDVEGIAGSSAGSPGRSTLPQVPNEARWLSGRMPEVGFNGAITGLILGLFVGFILGALSGRPPAEAGIVMGFLGALVGYLLDRILSRRKISATMRGAASIQAPGAPVPARSAAEERPPLASALPPGSSAQMTLIAGILFLSALCMATGVGALVYGVLNYPFDGGQFWVCVGTAVGFFSGGGFGLFKSWNNYRQMEGARDLMHEPNWTWFDRVLAVYGLLGLLLAVTGLSLTSSFPWPAAGGMLVIGGTIFVQAGVFLAIRSLLRRGTQQDLLAAQRNEPSSALPGGALPLGVGPRLLYLALCGVFCAVSALAAVAICIYAVIEYPVDSADYWGWICGGLGTLLGCAFGIFGLWGEYRQWKGLGNPMKDPSWSWFDTAAVVVVILAVGACLPGLESIPSLPLPASANLRRLGAVVGFMALVFMIARFVGRRTGRLRKSATLPDERRGTDDHGHTV